MSQWSHEHPELVGTDADPWMIDGRHRLAAKAAAMHQQFPNLDAMIAAAEADSSHFCPDCAETQCEQPDNACRECGGKLKEREG